MNRLASVEDWSTSWLDETVFAGLGCMAHGVVVLSGASSWGAHERGYIELPDGDGTLRVDIAYDERKAPYVVDDQGNERTDYLLSLADEDDYLACAWARTTKDSALVGIGVDLCAREHFRKRESGRRDLSRLLFGEDEYAFAGLLDPHDEQLGFAALFAAKEASFKATAAPLRRWYDTHEQPLRYEVRHFVMSELGHMCGCGRDGAAQAAMDAMGIKRVVTHHVGVADMALVVAAALAD